MTLTIRAALAAMLIWLAGPAMAQSAGEVKDVDPALWVVNDKDTTIYLFGTVHVLKPGLGWFDDGVKTAFDASDTLVMEIVQPPPAEVMAIMADLSIDKSGKPLSSKMNEADRAAYLEALRKLAVPQAALEPLDPWAAALNIYYAGLGKAGYDLNSGVETQLRAAALARKIPILGLETMRGQLSIFDQLPTDIQLGYVRETVSGLDQIVPQTDELVRLWSVADTDNLAAQLNEGFDQLHLTDVLLTRRNANWAQWIDRRMAKPGTVFVAVGAGHLAGPTSVQSLLAAYGRHAERVLY